MVKKTTKNPHKKIPRSGVLSDEQLKEALKSFSAHPSQVAKEAKTIQIPYKFEPRPYQIEIFKQRELGCKRLIAVWHRRAGKDKTFFNVMVKEMLQRPGLYYYFLPTYAQGRKILWEGMDRDGFRTLSHLPDEFIKSKDNQEMRIELTNGAIFRVIGTDRIDSIVGTNPIGCIFSEFSLQDPSAWDFIRPILDENEGWALFNFTPRGKNHAYRLLEFAKTQKHWFTSILTVDDTKAISAEKLAQTREEIIQKNGDDAVFKQEYFCDFTGGLQGSFYAPIMLDLEKKGKIGVVPFEPYLPVHTSWDLGMDDATAIWFIQVHGKEIRLIDYFEDQGEGLPYYARILREKAQEHGYSYGNHYMPHDISVREMGTGKSRLAVALELLGRNVIPVRRMDLADGIDYVRRILPRCWFNKEYCEKGIDALMSYHKKWDEAKEIYSRQPVHDKSSHGSDAFRTFATGYVDEFESESKPVTMPKYGEHPYFKKKFESTNSLIKKWENSGKRKRY